MEQCIRQNFRHVRIGLGSPYEITLRLAMSGKMSLIGLAAVASQYRITTHCQSPASLAYILHSAASAPAGI